MAPSTTPSYALRFISGKYQGGEFPLVKGREIIVGRSSELDMVLIEDMVSRKHAKIQAQDDEISIVDLGSTNGTFVNGEKVKQHVLRDADDIAIGNTRFFFATSRPPGDVTQINQPGLGFEKE